MAVECSVCFENFGREGERCPKLLPCSHTVCLRCLRQLARGRRLQCPECRQGHQIPRGGLENYPTNRYILDNMESVARIASLEEAERRTEMKVTERITQLEAEKEEIRRNMAQVMEQQEAERVEAERLIRQEAEQRIIELQEDGDIQTEAWHKAHQESTIRNAELEAEIEQIRDLLTQGEYVDIEHGKGECFSRFRTDVEECRKCNPFLSILGILLVFILGLLEAIGIMAIGSVVIVVIIVVYIFYTTSGIILPVCFAMWDILIENKEECYARCKNDLKTNFTRSTDDIKGFFRRCKHGIFESYQCIGCHYLLFIMYPIILYMVLSVICVVSIPCAFVVILVGSVLGGIIFIVGAIVSSIVLSIVCIICLSAVVCFLLVMVACIILVASLCMIFCMIFRVINVSVQLCWGDTYGVSKSCTELKNCFVECKNGVEGFCTACAESIGKCFRFPGCEKFLSTLNIGIVIFVVGIVSVIGGATLVSTSVAIGATAIAICAIILGIIIIALLGYLLYLLIRCCCEACCN